MSTLKFSKELYPKIALIKAAYNFTDVAYLHLDSDQSYYYVTICEKSGTKEISENEFLNEMLCQSVRHEVYQQTKNIRELLLARAMATTVVLNDDLVQADDMVDQAPQFDENEILKDWFDDNEKG